LSSNPIWEKRFMPIMIVVSKVMSPKNSRMKSLVQDNAAGKSQSQPQSVGGDNKIGALKGAGLKRSKTRFVAILRANPVNLGIDHHLWPSSLAFTETVYPRPIAMGGAFLFPN